MQNRFDGMGAIVVGGAGGIGSAIARRLAAEGARVVIADLDLAGAHAVATEVGGLAIGIDVTDEDSVRTALARAAESLDGLRGVVSTAGYLPAALLVGTQLQDRAPSPPRNPTPS